MTVPAGNFLPPRPRPPLVEGEQEKALTKDDDELIARCSRNLHHADEDYDGADHIGREQVQQQPWTPADQRKEKIKKEKDKKVISYSNRRKMEGKAKKFLSRFDKHLQDTKNKTTTAIARRSAPPFPYNGEDFGGSPCNLCFLRPSISPVSSSLIHAETDAAAKTASAANTVKSKRSSYYDFMKSLIEKNDFYSPECNAHRDIPSSETK